MLIRLFKQTDIPREYRANFTHLYLDIGWFGILSGSTINFLNIYATRIGASGFQIGLISAMSAIVSLLLAIPAGRWISQRHTGHAVFWSSVFYRACFLPFIFLPWFFKQQGQIWAIIIVTFLMAIPLTPLGVGFTALFAEAVPSEYRARVAGIRNVTLSITFMLTSLLSGKILEAFPLPIGYQIVFGIGFIGGVMSSYHLYFVKPLGTEKSPLPPQPKMDSVPPADSPRNVSSALRLDIWRTPFKKVLLGLLAFHLAQYLAIPIFPLFNVRALHLTDDNIGIGTALFYLTVFIGSTQLGRVVHRLGHKKVTAIGAMGLAIYPIALAFSRTVTHYYLTSIVGGFNWALIGGAYANYMLEHIPAHDRPSHLAWYNIILNIAVLTGSLAGPVIAGNIDLFYALILFGILRFLSGLAILKWG